MPVHPEHAARLMRRATYASVGVAVVLILAKAVAWSLTGSVSLLATLVDSVLDAAASLVNLVAVRHALAPADREHRFGHGKLEALAGLGQAMFVLGSAAFLLVESIRRLVNPVALEALTPGLAVLALSIGLTFLLLTYQRHVISQTDSMAIRADSLHYRSDLLVNISVILALLLSTWGWAGFDGLFALGIALYILKTAWQILRQSFDHLMDRELPDEDRQQIKALAAGVTQVKGIHDLRSRRSGIAQFIQLHIELEDELQLLDAHQISEEVEAAILEAYPGAEVIIHIDPVSAVAAEKLPEF